MNLPAIDVPFTLPFEVPVLLHPPLVHFAIVIPVIILLLEIFNAVMKKRAISVVSLLLLVVLSVVLFGAFFTGKVDGSEAFDYMSSDAKETLKEHKLLGTYLAYGSLALLLLKFLNLTKKLGLRIVYLLALVAFVYFTLHQGKEGGELVFKHGTNVEAANDMREELADLKEESDEDKEDADEASADEDKASSEATTKESDDKAEVTEEKASEAKPAEEKAEEAPAKSDEKADEAKEEKPAEDSAEKTEEPKEEKTESNETK